MSWQERQYRPPEEEGAFRKALRRVFVEGDGFFSWSLPLFRFRGISVKLHLIFVLFIIARLVWAMGSMHSFILAAMSMGILFTLVLLHEFGHCFACRWVGGEANEILMWPLGGLAMCHPPNNWRANFITTVGGPMVNVVLTPILGLVLFAMSEGRTDLLIFNPLIPENVIGSAWFNGPSHYLRVAVWWAYYSNLLLLAFNVLLVMFPMDGGRLLQQILWSRMGYRKSMLIATNVGLVLAILLGLFATTAGGQSSNASTSNLLMIALFCGMTCWNEKRKLAFTEEGMYESAPGYAGALRAQEEEEERVAAAAAKRQMKAREDEFKRQAEVDRILAKIRETGMGSLTRHEQDTLRGETERKRRG